MEKINPCAGLVYIVQINEYEGMERDQDHLAEFSPEVLQQQ